ncbi:TPA: hypothetical protein ACTYSZ_003831 [Klebsiella aerogenes]
MMDFMNHSGRTLRVYALALNFLVLIAVVVLSAFGIWLVNEWVAA